MSDDFNKLPPLAVDHEVLATLAGIAGDEDPLFVVEIVELFVGAALQRIAELREALRKQDRKILREVAHDLKGSSGQLGASRMAQICASIETLSAAGSLNDVNDLLNQLDLEFERVNNDLSSLRPVSTESTPGRS